MPLTLACRLVAATAALVVPPTPGSVVLSAGDLDPGRPAVMVVAPPKDDRTVSLVIALRNLRGLESAPPVVVEVGIEHPGETGEKGPTLRKSLHLGDPDVTWLVGQPAGASLRVTLRTGDGQKNSIPYAVRAVEVTQTEPPADNPQALGDSVAFEIEPNDQWQVANSLRLGRTVYGLADDRPYLPRGDAPTPDESTAGQDWFTFEYADETPRLAYFALDFVDRDVPPDVRLYQVRDGKLVEYTRGIDPQSLQREKPPRPGANKFTTRVLTKGRYYLLVDACQPEYTLRTRLYDVPPYLTPEAAAKATPDELAAAARKAVRAAMDFQLLAGDSWHANTPRKGHPTDRVGNVHHETSTCLGCHATHFTTQSALAAVKAGYKVEEPYALRFLTERLINNPVPLHGYPEAVWARMIPAPANVLGRLSTIVIDHENLVAPQRHDSTHRAISEFLRLYYDGRDTIPPDETNGNNPVSRYKVATDSWRQLDEMARRTKDERYRTTRDLVARLLPQGQPQNTRDLAAQTIGLCIVDRKANEAKIQANVERLLALQHDDGHWPIKFDAGSPGAEMQTGESLHALTLAGLKPDHPAVRKGVIALLTRQKPFGGWLDLGPYEQFQTPFRETQWALIALATLYPGPGTTGWNGPLGPPPQDLPEGLTDAQLIARMDRIWDEPTDELRVAIATQLDHPNPLVRYAACRALGRVGGAAALRPLRDRLGDESKVVQRAAAESLRVLANQAWADLGTVGNFPRFTFTRLMIGALSDSDDRVRRGATRVFAAHFRDASRDLGLARVLLERLDDPDPVVQLQAVRGLWRWWYWQADTATRESIEDALIARLARPRHPWVRRNLIEALYIIGDENIRYLDKNWIPSLPQGEIRDRVTAAQHATTNRLASKFVAALERGDARQREGVLRAMSEFFERPVLGGRVGNDLEPMLVYDEAVPKVASALMKQMTDPDPAIRRLALQALVTVREDRDPALARAVLARQGDASAEVREWAATMVREFPLKLAAGPADPELAAVLDDLLKSDVPTAQAAALAVIERLGPGHAAGAEAVRSRLGSPAAVVRAAALRALMVFPALRSEAPVRAAVTRALADGDVDARVAAVQLALAYPGLAEEKALRQALEDSAPAHRAGLLATVAGQKSGKLAADLRVIGVVSLALDEADRGVREKALQAIQNHPALAANPAVAEGLAELARGDNPRQKEMAAALLRSRGRSSGAGGGPERLDLGFFEAKVLPVFAALGDDGQSCIGCHRSHTVLKLVPPAKDGTWSREAALANFRAALRVVNLATPRDSLLLRKPTWEAAEEAEAQNDPTKHAHAGGMRFEPDSSREYQVILDWINGARLNKNVSASATPPSR